MNMDYYNMGYNLGYKTGFYDGSKEANKEFAKKLKDIFIGWDTEFTYEDIERTIDNLVTEMLGEKYDI